MVNNFTHIHITYKKYALVICSTTLIILSTWYLTNGNRIMSYALRYVVYVFSFKRYPSNDDEKLVATHEFANYLRKTSWKFGDSENDLVIVVSKYDRQVCFKAKRDTHRSQLIKLHHFKLERFKIDPVSSW